MGTDGGVGLVHCRNFKQEVGTQGMVDRSAEAIVLELIEDPFEDVAQKGVRVCGPT